MSPKVTQAYKELKRQKIMEAGKIVFIRKGYEQTTMKDIIEESGLSKGGVYLYFSSKEEVFSALLEVSDNEYFSFIQRLLEEDGTQWDAITKLSEFIKRKIIEANDELAPAIYEYFFSVKRNNQVPPLLVKRYTRAQNCVKSLLERGVANGEFHPVVSLEEISKFMVSFMDGLSVNMIHLNSEIIGLDSQIDQMLFYLRHALQRSNSDKKNML
ncbi:MAG: TetR/AcrR family transcriptional regulator [Clostridia bacterium]|nr:TetR/AcrR family transcriptional regulator [Clostridia bacterium]